MAVLLPSLPSVGITGTHRHAKLEVNFAEDYLESACDSACFIGRETSWESPGRHAWERAECVLG